MRICSGKYRKLPQFCRDAVALERRKALFLILFLIWIVLNGRTAPDVLVTGAVIAAVLAAVFWKLTGFGPKKEIRAVRILPYLLGYAGLLLWEILKANLAVTGLIWSGKPPEPRLVHFSSGLRSGAANALLANSITLTPGTITVRQQNDLFLVHCLRGEYAKGLSSSGFIKLLKRMETIWRV